MDSSIVCGVDHSPGARAAARFAAELADRLALSAILVYVVAPPIPQGELGMAERTTDSAVVDELRRAGANLLEEVGQELKPGLELMAEMRLGDPSSVLAAVAEQADAAFVVVGSRGLSAVSALFLGSVSQRLAVHGPCPTVIVPDSGGTIGGAPIFCAVDDSKESRAAIATAAALAERLAVRLLLAHADPDEARTHDGEELLARLVVESGLGGSVERMMLRGEPAGAMVEAATSHKAGMIVVGSRGRGALATAALGSVSSAFAARAPCPVTIVRALPGPDPAES